METLRWAAERFIQCPKRGNRDFQDLPKETQQLFMRLPTFMRLLISQYESWLWSRAERLESSRGIEAAKKSMPPTMQEKLQLVLDAIKQSKTTKVKTDTI